MITACSSPVVLSPSLNSVIFLIQNTAGRLTLALSKTLVMRGSLNSPL